MINTACLVTLYYAGAHSSSPFKTLHEEVFVLVIVALVCGMFLAWATWATSGFERPSPPRRRRHNRGLGPSRDWASCTAFVVLIGLASWPWQGLRTAFAEGVCQLLEPMLATTFEGQTSIMMQPLRAPNAGDALTSRHTSTGSENIVADTALVLRLTRYAGQMQVQVSVRRDVYLPLVIFCALSAIAPLSWRRRLITLGVGSSIILLVGVASIYVLLGNIFSGRLMLAPQLAEVYPVSETWGNVLQFLYERWLTPPGNRVIGPLLLAVSLLALQVEHLRFGARHLRERPALDVG